MQKNTMKKFSQHPHDLKEKPMVDENSFNKKKVEKKKHYEKPDYYDLGFDDEKEYREFQRFLR